MAVDVVNSRSSLILQVTILQLVARVKVLAVRTSMQQ